MATDKEKIFSDISDILVEILDVPFTQVLPETYLMRDLAAESIDLMELAVGLNMRCGIEVDEDLIFLKSLRPVVEKAREECVDPASAVAEKFSFLSARRILDILADLEDGPVVKIKDLAAYLIHANET